MAGETSPVNAPDSSQWTFWAATAISVPASASTAAPSETNGGQTATSTPSSEASRSRSSMQNSCVSAGPLKSFQFPATSGVSIARNLQPVYDPGMRGALDRTLALEVVRITEAAAMAAARWRGRGDKVAADQAAVDAMRRVMDTIPIRGTVVIGEGEKDEAPMLYNGEQVGTGEGPEVDIAVDPLEGTNLCARGAPNSIAVIAFAEGGTMLFPGAAVYMDKIAVGPEAKDAIDLDASPGDNVRRVAEAKGMRPDDVTVVVLDRDRHEELIGALRDVGARVSLITDGDVAPVIAAATPGSGVDLLMGVGGTPEGVISAAAVKSLGGAHARTAMASYRRRTAGARRLRLRRRPQAGD